MHYSPSLIYNKNKKKCMKFRLQLKKNSFLFYNSTLVVSWIATPGVSCTPATQRQHCKAPLNKCEYLISLDEDGRRWVTDCFVQWGREMISTFVMKTCNSAWFGILKDFDVLVWALCLVDDPSQGLSSAQVEDDCDSCVPLSGLAPVKSSWNGLTQWPS